METYKIRVSKDYLGFAAAHFTCFDNDQCERLHGHNYRIAVEVEDELKSDWMIFDFIELKQMVKGIADELDHHMLVPMKSDKLEIEADETRVRIFRHDERDGDKEWIFPREDCMLLPLGATTAELLACWFAGRLREDLTQRLNRVPRVVRVEIVESPGQSATYEIRVD